VHVVYRLVSRMCRLVEYWCCHRLCCYYYFDELSEMKRRNDGDFDAAAAT